MSLGLPADNKSAEILLTASGVLKKMQHFFNSPSNEEFMFREISFEIRRREVFALMGDNIYGRCKSSPSRSARLSNFGLELFSSKFELSKLQLFQPFLN